MYEVTINIPTDYLEALDTVYPITIDPYIYFNNSDITINDASISTMNIDNNSTIINAGYTSIQSNNKLIYNFPNLKTSIGSLNTSSYITKANLNLVYINSLYSNISASVYKMNTAWSPNASYTTQQLSTIYSGYDNTALDTRPLTIMPTSCGVSFNITKAVREWMNNVTNTVDSNKNPYGLMLSLNDNSKLIPFYSTRYSSDMCSISIYYQPYKWFSQLTYLCYDSTDENYYWDSGNDTDYSILNNLFYKKNISYDNAYYSSTTPFIVNYTSSDDVMSDGCKIASISMIMNNLGKTVTFYDIRKDQTVTKPVNPFNLSLVNINTGFTSSQYHVVYENPSNYYLYTSLDPMIQNKYSIFNEELDIYEYFYYTDDYFSVKTRSYNYSHIGSFSSLSVDEKKEFIRTLLIKHPEGIILNEGGHYVVLTYGTYDTTTKQYSTDFTTFDPGTSRIARGYARKLNESYYWYTSNFNYTNNAINVIYFD